MMEAEQLTLFAPATLANLSPTPGSDLARKMTATSGRKCLDLCASSGPLGSLERMLLGMPLWGSTTYLLTWKVKATPQGRSYFQLQPSAPRIDEIEYSLWPTPVQSDHKRRGPNSKQQGLPEKVRIWPTPKATLRGDCPSERERRTPDLHAAVKMWPTPQARDYRSGDNPDSPRAARKAEEGWSPNLNDAVKLWPTPRANDAEKRGNINAEDQRNGLPAAVKLWPTPNASDHRDRGNLSSPCIQRRIEIGKQVELSMCVSDKSGQLNPEWVECLMGFPQGWTDLDTDEPGESWIDNPRWPAGPGEEQYEWEPPRVAAGVRNRVPRLKACGNAVVPAHVFPILAAIKKIHDQAI